jgi:hypothetical protein
VGYHFDEVSIYDCYGLNQVPQNSYVEATPLVPQNVTSFGARVFKEVIRVGSHPVLMRRGNLDTLIDTRGVCTEERWYVDSKEAATCKPARQSSEETKPADTLTLGLPASRTVRKYMLLLKLPSLWYFVMIT